MHPELFGLVRSYPLFLVLGDLVGVGLAFWCARRAGIDLGRFAIALLVLTIAALSGAKLYGLIERGGAIGALQGEIFSGYRYPGAVVALAAAALLLGRWRWLDIGAGALADAITPSIGFGMAVVRAGCLLAGCCAGRVCSLPWAITFPSGSPVWHAQVREGLLAGQEAVSLPVHPLQLYFAALALGLGLAALWYQRRKAYDGQVFLLFVAAYGSGQALLEMIRSRPLPHVQYLSLAVALLAAVALIVRATALRESRPRRSGAGGSDAGETSRPIVSAP